MGVCRQNRLKDLHLIHHNLNKRHSRSRRGSCHLAKRKEPITGIGRARQAALRSDLFKALGRMSAPIWLAAAQAAASAWDPSPGPRSAPHTESAPGPGPFVPGSGPSGSGPSVPTWLRAARAAAGLAAPTGAGMPSAPRRNVATAAGQARRADGARPLTGLHRAPPLRPAAYEPPRTAAATIAEVRRVAQQRLLLLPRLHTKTAQRRAADEGELISFESQRENQCETAGLKWLDVAPQ